MHKHILNETEHSSIDYILCQIIDEAHSIQELGGSIVAELAGRIITNGYAIRQELEVPDSKPGHPENNFNGGGDAA